MRARINNAQIAQRSEIAGLKFQHLLESGFGAVIVASRQSLGCLREKLLATRAWESKLPGEKNRDRNCRKSTPHERNQCSTKETPLDGRVAVVRKAAPRSRLRANGIARDRQNHKISKTFSLGSRFFAKVCTPQEEVVHRKTSVL